MSQLDNFHKEYIRKCLEAFAPELVENLKESIVRKDVVSKEVKRKTDHLKDHITWKIADRNGWPVLQIWFRDYGRFVEIESKKTKQTVYSRMTSTEHALYGINRGKKKKNMMWYSRRTWGMTYHVLVPNVMFDLQNLLLESLTQIEA